MAALFQWLLLSQKILGPMSIGNIQEIKSLAAMEIKFKLWNKSPYMLPPNLNFLKDVTFCGTHGYTLCCFVYFYKKSFIVKIPVEKSFIYYEYKSMTSFPLETFVLTMKFFII